MKRILVTGGAGFIGSHLCKYLLDNTDDKVYCLDNLVTGSIDNIRKINDHERFIFLRQDIVEPDLEYIDVAQIYNLACPASPVAYQRDAIKTIKTNTIGVINMLELSKYLSARILQASTSEVYGDPLEHPQKETYWGNVNCTGIRSCYDEGKRVAETLFMDYHRKYGLDIKIARIFNTYGPNMQPDDGRVVSNFIIQALQEKPLTIYGGGLQTRSFCYVDDLVEGLYKLMNTENFTGPVNLGNPKEFRIRELADKVISLTNSKSEVKYVSLPDDDPKVRKPDITLVKKKLGWIPKVELEDGLKKTVEYFSNQLQIF